MSLSNVGLEVFRPKSSHTCSHYGTVVKCKFEPEASISVSRTHNTSMSTVKASWSQLPASGQVIEVCQNLPGDRLASSSVDGTTPYVQVRHTCMHPLPGCCYV